jgi:hypothetical protein
LFVSRREGEKECRESGPVERRGERRREKRKQRAERNTEKHR